MKPITWKFIPFDPDKYYEVVHSQPQAMEPDLSSDLSHKMRLLQRVMLHQVEQESRTKEMKVEVRTLNPPFVLFGPNGEALIFTKHYIYSTQKDQK